VMAFRPVAYGLGPRGGHDPLATIGFRRKLLEADTRRT
jgi:hypothetical protein